MVPYFFGEGLTHRLFVLVVRFERGTDVLLEEVEGQRWNYRLCTQAKPANVTAVPQWHVSSHATLNPVVVNALGLLLKVLSPIRIVHLIPDLVCSFRRISPEAVPGPETSKLFMFYGELIKRVNKTVDESTLTFETAYNSAHTE